MTNKLQRRQQEIRVRSKRAKACGWTEPFSQLPAPTQRAFSSTGNIRIPGRCGRKFFGKYAYGHKSGYCQKHLTKRDLQERAESRVDRFTCSTCGKEVSACDCPANQEPPFP